MRVPLPRSILAGCVLVAACSGGDEGARDLRTGPWHAWLDSPGGRLAFGLELAREDGALRAIVRNGAERLTVPRVGLADGELRLGFEHYDSAITATVSSDGTRLDGVWDKTAAGGGRTRLPFHAVAGEAPRSGQLPAGRRSPPGERGESVDGRWLVAFSRSDEAAVGLFATAADGTASGTFLTTTGDYRYLAGTFDGSRLRLSCFDGAHAFLFDARRAADGTLAGDFWSRDTWHETWTARRDDGAMLPDGFALTQWVDVDLETLRYPDPDGRLRSLADPEFAGRARILEVFGSWCPNCNDATRDLIELHREYRDRGLSVVGLAFELTGEFARDAQQVRVYAAHHGIEYPVLIAGVSDKARASEAFPLVDRIRSYPTTIFLHADGRVRAVHQGYTGPATGESHRALRERFRAIVEELLAGAAPVTGPPSR